MRLSHYTATVVLFAAAGAAMAIAEPVYTAVRTYDAFEVRHYEPYVVAETTVRGDADDASNEGFRILAAYLFGKNQGARSIEMTAPVAQTPVKIAMTAPVTQRTAAQGYVMQFAMPREWTMDTLPKPDDPRVTLHAMPARTLAVVKYSGTWSQANYDEHLQALRAAVTQAGLKWHGEPIWARYDAPWKPWFMRRNEIMLELD